ncbi:DUF1853 family protein [Psychrobacter sp. I-STPA10]|uniref:DUF1853 family protein n=1 Tax=Psychrobacter sp. I-STPA10 TaxID=2585769 RepID=UPI001E5DDD1F|nr:DUF1853 family protein [Psychrobacter sp. I-STPA10]
MRLSFFLGAPPYDYAHWVGINSRDNLQYKMTHMQKKQFRSVWVNVGEDVNKQTKVKIDKRMAVIKGRFFAPYCIDSNQQNFIRPAWLEPTFPLHYWIDVNKLSPIQLNQILHAIANQTSNIKISTNKHNPENLTIKLRRAHYIEWFSKRDFYDNKSISIDDIHQLTQIKQGLYFINDIPVVIFTGSFDYSKQAIP